jgi:hypothetical protein
VAYIEPADFHSGSRKAWTEGLALDEGDGDEEYLEGVIAIIQERVDRELHDTFEAPNPDNDITIDVDVSGASRRLRIPRRVRSLTTVKTRSATGALFAEPSTVWRLHTSDTPSPSDYLEVIDGQTISTGYWPVGLQTVQLVGKFGYVIPPEDVKRLTALWVYDYVRPKDDPYSSISERTTADGTITYGDGEVQDIISRYQRFEVLAR